MSEQNEIADGIFVTRNVFSAEECQKFIELTEQTGYDAATMDAFGVAIRRPSLRNNDRVILDDQLLAEELWQRCKPFVPNVLNGKLTIGLNERLRFYRYEAGQKFAQHFDGSFRRPNGEQSLLTWMIYLNEDFTGGETNFNGAGIEIKPETGMMLVFRHELIHEGTEVQSGRKYVLRSVVMFL
ncbi:MAG TPA: 2OG-Fe(II) oxygenase [Pyrinomonadaceae bacterium]|jgi:predicted 2-oxoglutarate/Fe(II)-dependent dioxygenase YbiX